MILGALLQVDVHMVVVVLRLAFQQSAFPPAAGRIFFTLSQQFGAELSAAPPGKWPLPSQALSRVMVVLRRRCGWWACHLRRDPPAKLLCFGELTGQHQGIEAGSSLMSVIRRVPCVRWTNRSPSDLLHPTGGPESALVRIGEYPSARDTSLPAPAAGFAVDLIRRGWLQGLRVLKQMFASWFNVVPPVSGHAEKAAAYQPPAYISWLTCAV